MSALEDLFLNGWGWLTLSVILIGLEFLAPGVYLMFVGFAALIVSIAVFILPGLGGEWQLIAFAVLAVISVLIGKKYLMEKETASDDPTLNKRGTQYIGRKCEVVTAFKNGTGRIRVEDTNWSATGDKDFAAGASVKIVGMDGTRFKVEAVKKTGK